MNFLYSFFCIEKGCFAYFASISLDQILTKGNLIMSKSLYFVLPVLLLIVLFFGYRRCMWIGKTLEGFKLVRSEKAQDAHHSKLYEFEHIKTGAKVVMVSNDDPHKFYSMHFKAPTKDDTGVSHILEHSVLAGSEKYPVQTGDMFFQLMKQTGATFLNAMTGIDIVMYVYSSPNDTDFYNLMDVYMDAALFPLLTKETFLREGWRYDMDQKNKITGANGIVFNEMKTAYSNPDRLFYMESIRSFYDDTLKFEAGGDPFHIPDLTYEDFKEYHKAYYHPTNSMTFLYGNGSVRKQLSKLNAEFSKFDRATEVHYDYSQNLITKPVERTTTFPAADGENEGYMGFQYAMGPYSDVAFKKQADVLAFLLAGYESAPLLKAIKDAGLGSNVSTFVYPLRGETTFFVWIYGADVKKEKEIKDLIASTLRDVVKKGFSEKVVEAAKSSARYDLLKEYANPGEHLFDIVADAWIYNADMLDPLKHQDVYDRFSTAIDRENVFEDMVKKYMIANQQRSVVVMKPDVKMTERVEKKLKDKVIETGAKKSSEEREIIAKELASYEALQKQSKASSGEILPRLMLDEVDMKLPKHRVEEHDFDHNAKLLYHPIAEHGLTRLSWYFDLRNVDVNLLPYVSLYNLLMGKMPTQDYSVEDLVFAEKTKLGTETETFVRTSSMYQNSEDVMAKFVFKGSSFNQSIEDMIELQMEVLFRTDLSDKKLMKTIIHHEINEIETAWRQKGRPVFDGAHAYSAFNSYINGEKYYQFLKYLDQNFDKEYDKVVLQIEALRHTVFVANDLIVSAIGSAQDQRRLYNLVSKTVSELSVREKDFNDTFSFKRDGVNKAVITPARNMENYVSLQMPELPFSQMSVLAQILRLDYYMPEIREKGGAYGARVTPGLDGVVILQSYADPHLVKSFSVFDKTGDYLRGTDLSVDELNSAKIKTLMDNYLDPQTSFQLGDSYMYRMLRGYSENAYQKDFHSVLDMTVDDAKSAGDVFDKAMKTKMIFSVGNEDIIEKNKKLFKKVYPMGDLN